MGDLIAGIAFGAYLLFTGYSIGWKGDYTMINRWHHIVVAEENQAAFCRSMGMGQVIAGLGCLAMPLLNRLSADLGYWVLLVFVFIGAAMALTSVFRYAKIRR